MVVLVVIVGNNITTTKETKEEAREIDESKSAILWQMNIQPPDMGWLSVMKKTEPLWVLK